jgi:DNA polymerase type B, organellar and viral
MADKQTKRAAGQKKTKADGSKNKESAKRSAETAPKGAIGLSAPKGAIGLSTAQDAVRLRNAEWILARLQEDKDPVYTMDIETDPFARGRVPVPFVIGFYDGLTFWDFWTDHKSTCIEKVQRFLEDETVEPGIVYMHNGGRFDFFYMLEWFEGKTTIINSRIVSALMPIGQTRRRFERGYRFEFRDSYAIMPFPLRAYQKDELPIEYLDRKNRGAHTEEIRSYLRGDCVYLWDLCMGFQREFGDYKTIASAAFAQLSSFHKYECLPKRTDEELRGKYYFGGRVQCFEKGVIKKPVTIYDVNSMYPFVMDTYYHPVTWPLTVDNKVHGWKDDGTFSREKLKTFFLTVEGENDGAFPTRMPDGSVDFTIEQGIFHVTIHEWLVALELGRFKPTRIIDSYSFTEYSCFHLFVDHFYKLRKKVTAQFNEHKLTCEGCGGHPARLCMMGADLTAHSMYYKYVLNSAYGKFGINPENYSNWKITKTNTAPKGEGWTLDMISHDKFFVWKQPSQLFWNVKNIGTAASITGAARSILLRAIARSAGVVYCDTDSIICENFGSDSALRIDDKTLGAWKPEGHGALAAIAGKKMYAVFDDSGVCIKHANKGVALTPEQILALANGEEILTWRDAPTFQRDGSAKFIQRTVRMT